MAKHVKLPKGFRAAGVRAGITTRQRPDMALIVSDQLAVTAGVFTVNALRAAPVRITEQRVRSGRAMAVLANSGNANCCTGRQGTRTAQRLGDGVADLLEVAPKHVLLASTGKIGVPLPEAKMATALPRLVGRLRHDRIHEAAQAILTTDLKVKLVSKRWRVGKHRGHLVGCAKGSGMIQPHMATMLAFLVTDVSVTAHAARKALSDATAVSFNRITVDGDMSTNDTVLLLANGAAGPRTPIAVGKPGWLAFQQAVEEAAVELAQAIVADGEGASTLIEVWVDGARSHTDAESIARTVINSPLVKTAMGAGDPNWGRIAAAVGVTVTVVPDQVAIGFYRPKGSTRAGQVTRPRNVQWVCRRGCAVPGASRAARVLRGRAVGVSIKVGRGRGRATMWGCDLSEEYVHINKKYE